MRILSASRRPGYSLLLLALGCTSGENDWQSLLSDADPNVRRAAIREIGDSSDSAAVIPVLVPVLYDSDATVRLAAALAILQIDPGNAACRPVIEHALREGQGPTFIAVGACGAKADWVVPTLRELLSDRRTSVRALAAKTLGEVATQESDVEAALRRSLRDESRVVRDATEQSLRKIQASAAESETE